MVTDPVPRVSEARRDGRPAAAGTTSAAEGDACAPRRDAVRAFWIAVLLVALGDAARVWQIGAQSLWLDEALSVIFAARPLPRLIATLIYQDLHPPLYYLLLHGWMALVGQSEFAVRYLSLLLGMPTIPGTFVFGRALFRRDGTGGRLEAARGHAIGLLAALMVTLSPFLVYYSQEARMYGALATFGVLSTYALWRALRGGGRWWLLYLVCATAALYTQYFGGLVIAFQSLYLIGLIVRGEKQAQRGLLSIAGVGLLYLPWLPAAYLQMQRLFQVPDFWKGELSLSYVAEHVFAAFTIGQYPALAHHPFVSLAAVLLLTVGIVSLSRQALRRGRAAVYLLGYTVIPFVALYAILARNPKFTERYLITIAPPFYLILAFIIVEWFLAIRRVHSIPARIAAGVPPTALAVVLLATSLSQLWQVYYGPGYRKDDNRAAVSYIEQHYEPGDIVVLMMDTYQAFEYYDRKGIPWAALQPGTDVQGAARALNQILAGHRRAWFLLWNADWADPTGYVRRSLRSAYPQLPVGRQFTGLELQLYQIDHPPHFTVRTTPDHPSPVDFGGRLRLLGYDLPRAALAAGTSSEITLYWNALEPLTKDYIVSLRLTDGRFYYWRQDRRPAADTYPTMNWRAGDVVTGTLAFQVPAGTPPGTYLLEVGVYAQEDHRDLDVLEQGRIPVGTSARIATITVSRPTTPVNPADLSIPHPLDVAVADGIRLLGASVDTPSAPPGGTVELTLWWQALRGSLPAYRVRVDLRDGPYQRTVVDEPPAAGTYSTTSWQAGEVVVDKHRFTLPPDAPPGTATLVARLELAASANTAIANAPSVEMGTVTILGRPVDRTPPAGIGHPGNWQIGSFARLMGFDLSTTAARPGDHLSLTLYWNALGNSGATSYTVFTHLLDSQDLIWAQQDHPPGGGQAPTTGWIAGEYIVDRYELIIRSGARPGLYRLEVGMYDPTTGARLPIRGPDGRSLGDRIILATVQIR